MFLSRDLLLVLRLGDLDLDLRLSLDLLRRSLDFDRLSLDLDRLSLDRDRDLLLNFEKIQVSCCYI